jgi:hypothetical protein
VRRLGPFLFLLLLSISLVAAAQENDAHFLTPRIATTAHRSTFVHGYLHGYEEGFHNGDFDLHMGRITRGEYTRDAKLSGYKKQFGPKQMFASGFREGFRVGYGDAAAGRSFRAIQNVEAASGSDTANDVREILTYDEGIRQGYLAGQHQGLDDARGQHASKPSPACPINTGATKAEFCAAYASGYGMGYSDGYVNQAKTVVAEAK